MSFKQVQVFISVVIVQQLSCLRLLVTPGTPARQASLSFIIFWSWLKLMSIESLMPSNHFILFCPHLLLFSVIPGIRIFSNELALGIRWPKYWSFSFSKSHSSECSGLISFRIDWCPRDSLCQQRIYSLKYYQTFKLIAVYSAQYKAHYILSSLSQECSFRDWLNALGKVVVKEIVLLQEWMNLISD